MGPRLGMQSTPKPPIARYAMLHMRPHSPATMPHTVLPIVLPRCPSSPSPIAIPHRHPPSPSPIAIPHRHSPITIAPHRHCLHHHDPLDLHAWLHVSSPRPPHIHLYNTPSYFTAHPLISSTFSYFTAHPLISQHILWFHNTSSYFTTHPLISQHILLFHNTSSCFTTHPLVSQHTLLFDGAPFAVLCVPLHNRLGWDRWRGIGVLGAWGTGVWRYRGIGA